MSVIALFGAGGKMGCRVLDNLKEHDHEILCVEISDAGRANLAQRGFEAVPQTEAVARADVVVAATEVDSPWPLQIMRRARTKGGSLALRRCRASGHASLNTVRCLVTAAASSAW